MKMEMYVTKRFRFEAAHHLCNYDGACANLHGHSYVLEVTFASPGVPAPTGMVVDFKDIKNQIGPIIDRLDHSCLNEILPDEYGYQEAPTAENLLKWIAHRIYFTSLGPGLKRLKLWETVDSYATLEISEV